MNIKYHKELCILYQDVVVIPKTVHKDRIIQNFGVFDFELSNEDMKEISKLDEQSSLFF